MTASWGRLRRRALDELGLACFLTSFVCLVACAERPKASSEGEQQTRAPVPALGLEGDSSDACAVRLAELEGLPALSGAPDFEELRVELLGRARSVPVVFARRPLPSAGGGPEIEGMRDELAAAADPADAIFQVLKRTRRRFAERRAVFLSEGYLYAEAPHLALRLSQVLRLDHLFEDPVLVVERGRHRRIATRHDGRYFWQDDTAPAPPFAAGSDAAPTDSRETVLRREANLLLLDRVRSESAPADPPLHVDFSSMREQLAFDQATVQRITSRGWVLRLQTGDVDSLAIARSEEGGAYLECELVPKGSEARLGALRAAKRRRAELLQPIMDAAHEIIERRLPFDEPRTEEGQQDGHLRIAFRKAYLQYQDTYEFNGDRYFVFDGFGRPIVPEVCIDFITDAIEWGTGGAWAERGTPRQHVRGAIDFKSFGLENARSIEQVAEFAGDHPEWFDMSFVPQEERVKFVYRSKFFQQIARRPGFYEVGDVVFILGLRDDGLFHYHSFFVDSVDPLTGAPLLLASNAGPPQVRTWEGEMHSAPLRSVIARMRLRSELLEAARDQAVHRPGVPLVPAVIERALLGPGSTDLPAAAEN